MRKPRGLPAKPPERREQGRGAARACAAPPPTRSAGPRPHWGPRRPSRWPRFRAASPASARASAAMGPPPSVSLASPARERREPRPRSRPPISGRPPASRWASLSPPHGLRLCRPARPPPGLDRGRGQGTAAAHRPARTPPSSGVPSPAAPPRDAPAGGGVGVGSAVWVGGRGLRTISWEQLLRRELNGSIVYCQYQHNRYCRTLIFNPYFILMSDTFND